MSLFKRFPSVNDLVSGIRDTFLRFSMALMCAVTGTVAMVILIDLPGPDRAYNQIHLAMTAGLGLPLFIAITTLSERMRWRWPIAFAAQVAGVLLLTAFYVSLPSDEALQNVSSLRLVILLVAAHALVAWVPFVGAGRISAFWEYNKTLLLRFAQAALYSGVLYAGLALALLTTDQLFELDIDEVRYGQLWFVIAGVFNTWFFLSGVPRDLGADQSKAYPIVLRMLAQYVLLTLVVVYFVILFVYEMKILITWDWPKGWASMPVLCFAVGGILTLLLLHPLKETSHWVRGFTAWFFRALLPLLVLLWLAIGIRVSDYGVTEPRYLVIAMGIGLTLVSFYFAFSRTRDIRVIPIVIAALALISAFGPWGAFSVSERSQQGRLQAMLERSGLWVEGALVDGAPSVSLDQRVEMSRVIDYLHEWHGVESFGRWIGAAEIATAQNDSVKSDEVAIAQLMGFHYEARYGYGLHNLTRVYSNVPNPDWLAGYEMLINVDAGALMDSARELHFEGEAYSCWVDIAFGGNELQIRIGSEDDHDSIDFNLADEVLRLAGESPSTHLPFDRVTFELESERYRIGLAILNANGEQVGDTLVLQYFNGRLLVGRK